MASIRNKKLLEEAYHATKSKLDAGDFPSTLLHPNVPFYRYINPASQYTLLPKPPTGSPLSKALADTLLVPADSIKDFGNRSSGPSPIPAIPSNAGLYCAGQQQALVNEMSHHRGIAPKWATANHCVLRLRASTILPVADLSPHNPRATRWVKELGKDMWKRMIDPDDCSAARGIAYAIAASGFFRGICSQTVRPSDRSLDERGDNIVLFSKPGLAVPYVHVDKAYYFGRKSEPEVFTVDSP